MKKFFVGAAGRALPVLAAAIAFAAMVLAGFASCASFSSAMSASKPTGPAYTGDGGAGKSLTILAPQGKGLTQEQDYLPLLAQGEFVSNFSDYSAISVLDRIRLDEQYSELYSGYYDDDAQGVYDLGHLIPTEYIMGGSITKTASGYALQISITRSTDKMTVASYSGTCTFAELDNLSGVRRASLDLLQKMGVESAEWAKAELSGAASRRSVQAQTALAQGISAQRAGNEFSAMTNYFEARTFDVALPEVQARMASAREQHSLRRRRRFFPSGSGDGRDTAAERGDTNRQRAERGDEGVARKSHGVLQSPPALRDCRGRFLFYREHKSEKRNG